MKKVTDKIILKVWDRLENPKISALRLANLVRKQLKAEGYGEVTYEQVKQAVINAPDVS